MMLFAARVTGAQAGVRSELVVNSIGPLRGQVPFNIPTLLQFTERSFLDNHCFANAGADVVNGRAVVRIDFSGAARIKSPDISGSMYLDRETADPSLRSG